MLPRFRFNTPHDDSCLTILIQAPYSLCEIPMSTISWTFADGQILHPERTIRQNDSQSTNAIKNPQPCTVLAAQMELHQPIVVPVGNLLKGL